MRLTKLLEWLSYPIEIAQQPRSLAFPSLPFLPLIMSMATTSVRLPLHAPCSNQTHSTTRVVKANSCLSSPLLLSQFPLSSSTQPHPSFCSSYSPPRQHRRGISPLHSSATEEGELIREEEVDEELEVDPTAEVRYLDPEADAESITEWEVDFCSRPILDERGKKVWELVVCDATLSLQFTRYFPNNVINSVTLKDAIANISSSLNVPVPNKIRFFRSQMQTIITRACDELGIKPIPSKRVCNSYSSS